MALSWIQTEFVVFLLLFENDAELVCFKLASSSDMGLLCFVIAAWIWPIWQRIRLVVVVVVGILVWEPKCHIILSNAPPLVELYGFEVGGPSWWKNNVTLPIFFLPNYQLLKVVTYLPILRASKVTNVANGSMLKNKLY